MQVVIYALKFANNVFNRIFLAIAGTLYAVSTAIGPDLTNNKSPMAYQVLVLSSGAKWLFASLFALSAFCLWWRLFDTHSRLIWAAFINVFTAILWSSVTCASIYVYGRFLPDSVGEIMVSLMSYYSVLRTYRTEVDRMTA